jgi:hypothetical protein
MIYSKLNLDSITKTFNLILEGQQPDTLGYAAVVVEILNVLKPSSQRDKRYIGVAKAHLNEITKHIRRLNERVNILEEQIKILEENKNLTKKE